MEIILSFFGKAILIKIGKAALLGIIGTVIIKMFVKPLVFALSKTLAESHLTAISKLLSYTLYTFLILAVLSTLGVDLKLLIGAAGIFTVALGFASQTSASNLISGIFLVMERPFSLGDTIQIGNVRGEVVSIDLLSTRIRTYNNTMIRVPNESLMKSQITNITYYPIRRIDLNISVAFNEDLKRIERLLTDIVDREPLVLDEPRPLFIVLKFAESSVDLQFSFWTQKVNYLTMKNNIYTKILEEFKNQKIEIPFPHRVIINSKS